MAGLVSGTTIATLCGLAAGRYALLKKLGHSVDVVADGRQAVDLTPSQGRLDPRFGSQRKVHVPVAERRYQLVKGRHVTFEPAV